MHGRTILSILSFNLVFGQGQVRFSKVSLLTPRLSEVLRIGFLRRQLSNAVVFSGSNFSDFSGSVLSQSCFGAAWFHPSRCDRLEPALKARMVKEVLIRYYVCYIPYNYFAQDVYVYMCFC